MPKPSVFPKAQTGSSESRRVLIRPAACPPPSRAPSCLSGKRGSTKRRFFHRLQNPTESRLPQKPHARCSAPEKSPAQSELSSARLVPRSRGAPWPAALPSRQRSLSESSAASRRPTTSRFRVSHLTWLRVNHADQELHERLSKPPSRSVRACSPDRHRSSLAVGKSTSSSSRAVGMGFNI